MDVNLKQIDDVSCGHQSSVAVVTALAAASAGANGDDQVNTNARGLKLVIDITALAGTSPTLTVTIQGKDAVSGKYFTILASAALASQATTVLTVYPGLTAATNVVANDVLPRDWRVIYAIGGSAGQAVTATIAAALLM